MCAHGPSLSPSDGGGGAALLGSGSPRGWSSGPRTGTGVWCFWSSGWGASLWLWQWGSLTPRLPSRRWWHMLRVVPGKRRLRARRGGRLGVFSLPCLCRWAAHCPLLARMQPRVAPVASVRPSVVLWARPLCPFLLPSLRWAHCGLGLGSLVLPPPPPPASVTSSGRPRAPLCARCPSLPTQSASPSCARLDPS